MHQFQPYPVDMLALNPFTKISTEWMAVTAGNREKANTMTASWGGFGVLWGKNVVYIFVRESRYTKEFIDHNDTFSLTFFDGHKMDLKYLGAVSGRNEDKIKNAHLTLNFSDDTPFLDEGNLVFVCRKLASMPFEESQFIDPKLAGFYKDNDYHTMYVGEITQILAR